MVFGILRLCLHHSAFRKTSRDLWFMPPRFHQPLTAIDDIHFRVLTLRRVRWVNPVESLGTLWSHSSTAATKWQRNVGPPPPPPEGTGSRGKEPTGNCRLKGEYWIIAWLWKQQLQALDRTYVCRLWSSGNSLWIYIYLYICMYIGMLWYKCFGGWRSPPINRVSPQVHIDLYIYMYVHIYLYIYIHIFISFILSHYAYRTALVGGFPEPTLTGCAESLALITVQGFVDGSFIFWASTNDIFRSFTLKSAVPPQKQTLFPWKYTFDWRCWYILWFLRSNC